MAITTRIAPMYGGQKIFAAVLFAVFGIWGVIDYGWTIPKRERISTRYEEVVVERNALVERQQQQRFLSQADTQALEAANAELAQLAPGGKVPAKPSKFDRAIQWAYISCLPFAPWFLIMFFKAKRQKYTLDDNETLSFTGDPEHKSGSWQRSEIADIDMSRWMAKSIAVVVHQDGRRLKLDAYLHKDLHLIIGAIANRFYPDQWDQEGKMIKADDGAGDEQQEIGGNPSSIDETLEHTAAT